MEKNVNINQEESLYRIKKFERFQEKKSFGFGHPSDKLYL